MTEETTSEATTTSIQVRTPERRKRGLWKKGESGNPKGKPKGAKNKLTLYREAVLLKQEKNLLDNLPQVLDVVIEKSLQGDMVAAKMFLERVLQAKKIADEHAEDKGPPTVVVNITGSGGRVSMGRQIEAEFTKLDERDERDERDNEETEEEFEYEDHE